MSFIYSLSMFLCVCVCVNSRIARVSRIRDRNHRNSFIHFFFSSIPFSYFSSSTLLSKQTDDEIDLFDALYKKTSELKGPSPKYDSEMYRVEFIPMRAEYYEDYAGTLLLFLRRVVEAFLGKEEDWTDDTKTEVSKVTNRYYRGFDVERSTDIKFHSKDKTIPEDVNHSFGTFCPAGKLATFVRTVLYSI